MQELLIPSGSKTPPQPCREFVTPSQSSNSAKNNSRSDKEFRVETIRDVGALKRHLIAWDDLAADAIERNPFYESWMLLPAAKTFAAKCQICFYLVWQRSPRPNQPETLVGLFPLEECPGSAGLPIRRLRVWQHDYLYYCVPLVRRSVARGVLHALFDAMSNDRPRFALLELHHVDRGSPFAQTLVDVTQERGASTFVTDEYNRALFRPERDYETYLERAMTNHNRQEVRRQRRRLTELGELEVRFLSSDDNLDEWLAHFLELEAAGWKGHEQTAMACDHASREYFEAIARGGFLRGQLMMLGLFLGGKPIALKCNFLAGDGSYAFKIAFDERLSKYSPGVQLEVENVRILHSMRSIRWMDSCAKRKHFMINRIWSDRRTIQNVLVSTGRWIDNVVVDSVSALATFRRTFRRTRINQFLSEQ